MSTSGLFTERTVFFEVPYGSQRAGRAIEPADYLTEVLSWVWCADTIDWENDGSIYNVSSAHDILCGGDGLGPDSGGLLNLFATGCGDPDGLGAEGTRYARAQDVDLLVSPMVGALLREQLATIERLYSVRDHEGVLA